MGVGDAAPNLCPVTGTEETGRRIMVDFKDMDDKEEKMVNYLKQGGSRCPFCGEGQIEGAGVEIDGGVAVQRVSCTECDGEWVDYYTLDHVAVSDGEDDLDVYNEDGLV